MVLAFTLGQKIVVAILVATLFFMLIDFLTYRGEEKERRDKEDWRHR